MILILSVIFTDYEISVIDTLSALIYNEDFSGFERKLKYYYNNDVDTNILRCLKLAYLELYMMDNSTDYRYDEFVSLLDTLMNIKGETLRERLFIAIGASIGAVFYGRRGNLPKAISLGNIAFNIFSEIYRTYPDVYDTYLPMGIYHFAMGYLSGSSERKKKGLEMVKEASEKANLVKPLTYASLVYMYIFDKKPAYGIKYALKALSMFPNSRTFRWILASAYKEAGMYEKSIKIYEEIIDDLKRRNPNCKVCIAEVYYHIGESYKKMGNDSLARENFWSSHRYLSMENDPYRQRKVKDIKAKLSKYGIK